MLGLDNLITNLIRIRRGDRWQMIHNRWQMKIWLYHRISIQWNGIKPQNLLTQKKWLNSRIFPDFKKVRMGVVNMLSAVPAVHNDITRFERRSLYKGRTVGGCHGGKVAICSLWLAPQSGRKQERRWRGENGIYYREMHPRLFLTWNQESFDGKNPSELEYLACHTGYSFNYAREGM